MTPTPQQPVDSGLGAGSTADEVLAGVDLSGRLALVTGGYSGLGLETTRALVRAGARVVVPARRPDAAREALTDLGDAVEVDELDLGDQAGVRAFSVHPGGILTPLQRRLPQEEMVALGWIDEAGREIGRGFKTPEQGAATTVWAATSSQLDGLGGVYCEDCDVAVDSEGRSRVGVAAWATDPAEAARLWALSVALTGTDLPADLPTDDLPASGA